MTLQIDNCLNLDTVGFFNRHLMEGYGLYLGFSLVPVPVNLLSMDYGFKMEVIVDFNIKAAEKHEFCFMVKQKLLQKVIQKRHVVF